MSEGRPDYDVGDLVVALCDEPVVGIKQGSVWRCTAVALGVHFITGAPGFGCQIDGPTPPCCVWWAASSFRKVDRLPDSLTEHLQVKQPEREQVPA